MGRAIEYKPLLLERLKDPEECRAYLNAALEDDDSGVFLVALRNVVEAQGGMSAIAKKSKLNRENLYRMLSEDGNPNLSSVSKLLDTLGFHIAII